METNFNNIPDELRRHPHWVNWTVEERTGKPTKVPINPKTGGNAMSNNPSTWGSYEQAVECYRECQNEYIRGIGFMLSNGYAGSDLDHCYNPATEEILPWAKQVVEVLASYAEITPSNEGVRVLVKGRLPEGRRVVKGLPSIDGGNRGEIALYDSVRFFTVTGNHLLGTPLTIESRDEELRRVHTSVFGGNRKPLEHNIDAPCSPCDLSDEEIIRKARNATNGAKFEKLWSGDCSDYPSQSEGDLALCQILAFWTGGDSERMDSLFRQSGLFREKWVKHRYNQRTIQKAVSLTRETYLSARDREIKKETDTKQIIGLTMHRGNGKTLSEILSSPHAEENYLIKPILSRGDKGYVVSSYKVGKTLFLTQMAFSLATGMPFLGLEVPRPAKVLYLRFELKETRFKQRLHRMMKGVTKKVEIEPVFEFVRGFNITDQKEFDYLLGLLDNHQPEVLMLDPLYKLTPFDLKDTANAIPLIRCFDRILSLYPNLCIVIAHHLRKQIGNDRDSWDNTYGPMFFFADMDFEIRLKAKHRKNPIFTLDHISNDVPVAPISFKRNPDTLLYYRIDLGADHTEDIIDYVSQKDSLSKHKLKDWMGSKWGVSRRDADEAIDRIITEGRMVNSGTKTKWSLSVSNEMYTLPIHELKKGVKLGDTFG